jgi:hypothetical protein
MDSMTLKVIEENEERATQEANDSLIERDAAQMRLDRANEALHAWRVLKRQAREALGITGAEAPPVKISEAAEFGEPTNKLQFVKSMVSAAGNAGINPAEILARVQEAYPDFKSPNFPYAQLSKLKATEEIWVNKKGRYFSGERPW